MADRHPCDGPCNRGYREAQNAYRAAAKAYRAALETWTAADPQKRGERPQPPAQPDTAPTYGDPVFCSHCTTRIRSRLADLDNLAAIAAASADGHRSGPAGDKVSGSRDGHTPSSTADMLDELYGDLTRVEDQWREANHLGARPRRSRGARALTTVVAWLLGHLDDILSHPGSVAFGRSVLTWHRRLEKATKAEPVVRRVGGRCPRCDRRALATRDDGYTECRGCGRLLDQDEYDALVQRQTEEEREATA